MFEPENELGVIVLFAQQCEAVGFEIVSIHSEFPDAIVKHDGQIYRVEFEYQSSNFNQHGHDPRKADVIICWEKDCDSVLPIIALAEPNCFGQEIALPTRAEREAAYWKQRALRAERAVKSVKRELERNNGNRQDEKHCPYCDAVFGSKQAVSAHLRFCDAYQAAQREETELTEDGEPAKAREGLEAVKRRFRDG